MRGFLGGSLSVVGCLVWAIFGIAAFLVNFSIVIVALGWGFLGGFLAFVFFPLTIVFAPWYALIAWGNTFPLIVTYGGGLLAMIIMAVGNAISGEE